MVFGVAIFLSVLIFAIIAVVKAITRRTRGWIVAGSIGGIALALPAVLIFSGVISGFVSAIRYEWNARSHLKTDATLVGEWKGTDEVKQTGYMILNGDRTARLIIGNQVLDGTTLGGKFEWRIDSTHNPMHLDFIATRSDGTQGMLPMIFRFVGQRRIQLRWSEDFASRPAGFSDLNSNTQLVLTKQ
jgi:hypothetical protein